MIFEYRKKITKPTIQLDMKKQIEKEHMEKASYAIGGPLVKDEQCSSIWFIDLTRCPCALHYMLF